MRTAAGICQMVERTRTRRDIIKAAYPKQFKRILELSDNVIDWPDLGHRAGRLLEFAFVWRDTKEGYDYWKILSEKHQ